MTDKKLEVKLDEDGKPIEEAKDVIAEKASADKKKVADKTIKTFTQKEVNEIVKNRLSIQKKKNSKNVDEDTIEKELLSSTIEGYEVIIKGVIEAKKSEMPNDYLELINKLSLSEQYEFLMKQDKLLQEKKKIPNTPISKKGDNKGKSTGFNKVKVF